MRTLEDRPAFQRPWVTRFGIPEPRKLTPDIRHWVWTSKAAPDVATLSVPLYPTYAARLVAVRAMTKVAGSTQTTGQLLINGFVAVTFVIDPTLRQGWRARPQLRDRWGVNDYLELNITALGTDAGQLVVILDHIRAEV